MSVDQLRIYTVARDRREAFFRRWDNHAVPLMASHGFHIVEVWEGCVDPVTPSPTNWLMGLRLRARHPRQPIAEDAVFEFGYRLTWPNRDSLTQGWHEFLSDPRWIEAKKQSRADGSREPVLLVTDRVLTPRKLSA